MDDPIIIAIVVEIAQKANVTDPFQLVVLEELVTDVVTIYRRLDESPVQRLVRRAVMVMNPEKDRMTL